jgi:uracil-DNA glycosylase
MRPRIGNGWDDILAPAFAEESYQTLRTFLEAEYAEKTVYPPKEDIFNAFRLTPPETCCAVILGQDPYINPQQAHGLAFSVRVGQPLPPSLQNIFAERETDLSRPRPAHGCLEHWARQGVLLLNTVLTVRGGASQSHAGHGWEPFTDFVIRHLGGLAEPICFILWGRPAQKKEGLIANPNHCVLKAPHPSPLSAHGGFFGSRPFSKANAFLRERGRPEIHW